VKKFSKYKKYLLSAYLLMVGRAIFFISLASMALSVYLGTESVNHKDAITPEPIIFGLALLLFFVWAVAIISSVILSYNLTCDNCGARLCKVPHGYKGSKKRSWVVSFFYPDDIYEKKLKCFNCATEYEL